MPKVASPSSRARNDASPRDLIKILRANMSSFDEQWKTQDVESFVNTYQELLVDLCSATARPNASLVKEAVVLCWRDVSMDDAKQFGDRIAHAVSFVRGKIHSMTTGKKLSEPVKVLVDVLSKRQSLGQSLLLGARRRQLQATSPKKLVGSQFPLEVEDSDVEVVASKASSSSKAPSSATRSRADIFAMFGLQEGNQQHPTKRHEDSSVVEVDDSPVKKARGNPVTVQTQFLDSAKLCMVRVLSSGEEVSSVMKAGPNGFAEAFLPGEVVGIPSELPNLLLQLPIKEAPSRQAVKKRPAGKPQKKPEAKENYDNDSSPAAAEEPEVEEVSPEEEKATPASLSGPAAPKELSMPYKYPKGSWALREKHGSKKQVLSLTSNKLSSDALQAVVLQCREKLLAGGSQHVVKAWGLKQLPK